MADEPKIESQVESTEPATEKTRRTFVKTAAQVAVTAPAVAVLLNATTKPASAVAINPYAARVSHILDDFTFGSNEEDIDAINQHSNFNPWNGQAQQDDVAP